MLTTMGRVTGLPREAELWCVEWGGRIYVLAETGLRAQWVRNLRRQPRVRVRLAGNERDARARVLDPHRDAVAWAAAQGAFKAKYGWGDGLPVEITPRSAAQIEELPHGAHVEGRAQADDQVLRPGT